jgi:pimeloyl-ACP methyl ester carboxylesterase
VTVTESVQLRAGAGGVLVGDLDVPAGAAGWAVLFVHGFGSRRSGDKAVALRDACRARGWAFAAFDFRGHGDSTFGPGAVKLRELRGSGLLEDLEAVRAFLASRGFERVGLVGSSMGGWASSWFALDCHAVPAVVLLAPAFRFLHARWDRLSAEEQAAFRAQGYWPVRSDWVETELGWGLVEERERFPPGLLTARWQKPALIFHGLDDDVVPPLDSIAFAQQTSARAVEVRLLKAGDHRLTAFADEIASEACRFLAPFAAGMA